MNRIINSMFFGAILSVGCAPEENAIDLRNQISGSYEYNKTVYHNHGIDTQTGTLSIVNNESENFKLIVTPEETFYGTTLDAVDSSLVFFIPEQDHVNEEGGVLTIKGVSNVKVGDRNCDAGYFPEQNKLKLYYTVSYEQNPHLDYNVTILAEKLE